MPNGDNARLREAIEQAMRDERPLSGAVYTDQTITAAQLERLETEDIRFVRCRFSESQFEKACFYRSQFENCDFSNCVFRDSYWKECVISDGRWNGANFDHASLHAVRMESVPMRYANFNEALLEGCSMQKCDLSDAGFAGVKLKKTVFSQINFCQADFFGTLFKGVSLADSQIEGVQLSEDMREVRGAKVSAEQAISFARRFGIIIV